MIFFSSLIKSVIFCILILIFCNTNAQNTCYLNNAGSFIDSEEAASLKIEVIQKEENIFAIYFSAKSDGKWTKPEFTQKIKKISDSTLQYFDDEKMKEPIFTREIIEKTRTGYKVKQTNPDGMVSLVCEVIEIIPFRLNGKCTIFDCDRWPMSEEIYINGKRISEILQFHPVDTTKLLSKEPEFQGGILGFRKKIASTARYPISAIEKRQEGKAYAKFLINENGKMEQVKNATFQSTYLSKELVRTISCINDLWAPAESNGAKISVWYYASIKFNGVHTF